MTSPDRSRPSDDGRYPSLATVELLRSAFARFLSGEIGEEEVCQAVDGLAREAEERRLEGGQILGALRDVWNNLPEAERIRDPSTRKRLLEHLVKICMTAYYERALR